MAIANAPHKRCKGVIRPICKREIEKKTQKLGMKTSKNQTRSTAPFEAKDWSQKHENHTY